MPTIDYNYKIDDIVAKIEELDAKNVILQFPEGLKMDATEVANEIDEKTDRKSVV